VDRTEVAMRAEADDRTWQVAASHRRQRTLVYGCSKNASNRATFGHFSGRPGRLAGGKGHSVCGYRINRSDRASRQGSQPKTEWPRGPQNGHFHGHLLFTISTGQ
jgi:hypothetical protein